MTHRSGEGRRRFYASALAAFLGVGGLATVGVGLTLPADAPSHPAVVAAGTIPPSTATIPAPGPEAIPVAPKPDPAPPVMPVSAPVSLHIPKIGVTTSLVPLGLNPDHTIQVPPLNQPMQAGWYTGAPTPGELGPAVILGHIDSSKGPAVFYHLDQLQPGDTAEVTRTDGLVARFVVDAVREYAKDHFPTQDVYGPLGYAGLRLITCGGTFDRHTRQYLDNTVIYAHLLAPDPPHPTPAAAPPTRRAT